MPRFMAASIAVALMCATWFGQELALETVLQRAAAYVADFHHQMAGIVVEEHYIQEVRVPVETGQGRPIGGPSHRSLASDLLLVRPVGGGPLCGVPRCV